MAITVGTVAPMVPYSSVGNGKSAQLVLPFALNTSQTVGVGDVLVMSSGKASVGNSDPDSNTIIGVAVDRKTTAGSVTDDDFVGVACATPGQVFIGSLVGGAATDQTSFTYGTHTNAGFDLIELTVEGYAAIDGGDTTPNTGQLPAYILGPAREQLKGANFSASGVSATNPNPRVYFVFSQSIFTQLLQ